MFTLANYFGKIKMNKQIVIDFQHTQSYSKQDFLSSEANELAFNWIKKFPNWDSSKITIIYGSSGCGKTHLGKIWQEMSNALEIKKSDECNGDTINRLLSGENILIDDYDKLCIDDKFLYNLYNASKNMNSGFVLITASKRPLDWGITLADAKSRILSINTIEIKEPDDFLLSGLLIKLFSDRQLKISPEIINYILIRMERSFKKAISLVERIDKLSLEKKRNITIPLIKDII